MTPGQGNRLTEPGYHSTPAGVRGPRPEKVTAAGEGAAAVAGDLIACRSASRN